MTGRRIERVYETVLNAAPEKVFPLLCPVREYEWIPQWQCEMIHCDSGVAELGCVFATDFDDGFGREIWVVSHFEPDSKICFVRTGPVRTTRYVIELTPETQGTRICWQQEITGLEDPDDSGDSLVEAHSEVKYKTMMTHLNQMLDYYLQHGTPLNINLSRTHNTREMGEEDGSIGR